MSAWRWHDLHVHTYPHSPDAHRRASLAAVLKQAAKQGVPLVGLANHYFPTTNFELFAKLRQQVAETNGEDVAVLVGAEVCVRDSREAVKLTRAEAAQLDFVLAGPHHFSQRWVEPPPVGDAAAFVAHQHQMLLAAARHPLVNGLAHPWVINIQHAPRRWGFTPTQFLAAWGEDHFAELGAVAAQHHTALEVGMGIHLMAEHQGPLFWQRYARGLQAARASGAKFFFGSDAHHLFVVARTDWLEPTLEALGFQPADIILPAAWLARN